MSEKRASARRVPVGRRRSVPGGREGLGEGEGDGEGVKDKEKSGSGFVFGQSGLSSKVGDDAPGGSKVKQVSGLNRLSYRDKLLSPGCAGFLMKHSEEEDIVRGWKDYFNGMNEKEASEARVESEEDVNQEENLLEGRPGILSFSAEEYAAWCLPWMNSLILKVLGANFPTYIIRDRINRMWRPKDPLKLIPLSNGYYIVSFSNKEDRDYAFQEGPWMIEDHYLIVQRWRPNFNPWKADLQCQIAAWVRLPDVPFEFYNVESLRRIGNMIGRMIKVDRSTSIYDKGGFARICVELDLQKPLLPSYKVFGEERPIVYEGLHHVCFTCGKYGHQKDKCPTTQNKDEVQSADGATMGNDPGNNSRDLTKEEEKSGGSTATIVSGDSPSGASPFGKIQILRREFRGAPSRADMKQVENKSINQGVDRRKSADHHESSHPDIKKGLVQENKEVLLGDRVNKGELNKGKGPVKSEWVQVGNKRKNVSKGKSKGKEFKTPARVDSAIPNVGHDVRINHNNSFQVLQASDVSHLGANVAPAITHVTQIQEQHSIHVEIDHDPSTLASSSITGDNARAAQNQVDSIPSQDNMDAQMFEQDKSEGEAAIPHHTPTVSQ
ncbi:hypothetical protein K1719_026648 [Acacia pycnantha]|nr:hypothetical protein K1719_026648 [Acacia pycnantha]